MSLQAAYKRCSTLLMGLLLALSANAEDIVDSIPEAAYRARIAIIIDDFGYQLEQGHWFVGLPYDLTFAIIPFTPYDTNLSRLMSRSQREVMIHAPMETLSWSRWERGLDTAMNREQLRGRVEEMLQAVPDAVGVNNHGGSKLTQDNLRMRWLMSILAERQLFFVDSRTVAESIAIEAALAAAVEHAARDVFLDNKKERQEIQQQLYKLRSIALRRGSAIGIGHPYRETLRVLRDELPKFTRQGVQIVKVSKLLRNTTVTSENLIALNEK